MKVLLINPPITYYKTDVEYSPSEPLGLMYLGAYLRRYGDCEVKILDASARKDLRRWENDFLIFGYTEDMIANEVYNFQPDLVGISSMFTVNSKGVHDVAGIVKKVNKDIPVIFGGAHASSFPEWILRDRNVDIVVKGEGEITLLEITNALSNKQDISQLEGIIFKKDGRIIENPNRPLIKDLDTVPFPARDLLDMNFYLYENYNYTHAMSPPRLSIVSSRGCPYNCIYCSIHSLWHHTYRMRRPSYVVDEIEFLVNNYGVREISFFDDNLTLDRKRMLEICDEIIRRKIRIKWCTPNGVAIMTLDEEVLSKMKESGCYKLTFGIETASPKTQKFIRKDYIDLGKSKKIIRFCNKIGIWTHSTFIIGFPYEIEEDIMLTIDYAINCGADMATFFIATPYPGSEMFCIYQKEGLLPELGDEKSMKWFASINKAMCDTKNFTCEEIERYFKLAQKKVFINRAISFCNPLKLLSKLKGRDEASYFIKQLIIHSKKLIRSLLKKK